MRYFLGWDEDELRSESSSGSSRRLRYLPKRQKINGEEIFGEANVEQALKVARAVAVSEALDQEEDLRASFEREQGSSSSERSTSLQKLIGEINVSGAPDAPKQYSNPTTREAARGPQESYSSQPVNMSLLEYTSCEVLVKEDCVRYEPAPYEVNPMRVLERLGPQAFQLEAGVLDAKNGTETPVFDSAAQTRNRWRVVKRASREVLRALRDASPDAGESEQSGLQSGSLSSREVRHETALGSSRIKQEAIKGKNGGFIPRAGVPRLFAASTVFEDDFTNAYRFN